MQGRNAACKSQLSDLLTATFHEQAIKGLRAIITCRAELLMSTTSSSRVLRVSDMAVMLFPFDHRLTESLLCSTINALRFLHLPAWPKG